MADETAAPDAAADDRPKVWLLSVLDKDECDDLVREVFTSAEAARAWLAEWCREQWRENSDERWHLPQADPLAVAAYFGAFDDQEYTVEEVTVDNEFAIDLASYDLPDHLEMCKTETEVADEAGWTPDEVLATRTRFEALHPDLTEVPVSDDNYLDWLREAAREYLAGLYVTGLTDEDDDEEGEETRPGHQAPATQAGRPAVY